MSLFNLWKIVRKLSNKGQSHTNEESKQLYKCTKREVLYEESRVCWFNQAWIKEFGKNKNEIFFAQFADNIPLFVTEHWQFLIHRFLLRLLHQP